jgi:hypothetical protein
LSNDQSSDQSPIYNGNSNGQAAMHIGSALRAELTKDSQGNPVMMVISPDPVAAIQQENVDTNTGSTATHNATGATPGATNP